MHPKSIAIIKAGWHVEIVGEFVTACRDTLQSSGSSLNVSEYEVPGVVEIPLFAQKLIERGNVDVVIAVGLIADHGVYRHEFVASSVMDATMRVQLDTGVPIIYGILTPQDFLSEGREAFFKDHFALKGQEAANACLKTIANDELLSTLSVQTA